MRKKIKENPKTSTVTIIVAILVSIYKILIENGLI